MSDLLTASATEAAAAIASGEVTARELADALSARIDALNPRLNAIVARAPDGGGGAAGPLGGVPVTIKDAFDVDGLPTTWGNPAFAGAVAGRDATVVARLRAAGAVVTGKTNVALMLGDPGDTGNPLFGATHNPYDLARTPGGSSGGAAAAVASGLSFLDVGSDLAGSIRVPAAFCGVYGLKPTAGTVPLTGFAPPAPPGPPPTELTYACAVGPIARSAEDLRTALRVTAGPDGAAAKAYRWSPAPSRLTRPAGARIGVVLDEPLDGDVGAVLSDAVDALAAAGATIVEGWPAGLDPRRSYEAFGGHLTAYFALHGMGDDESFRGFAGHEAQRMSARAAWQTAFAGMDAFLCPVTPVAAFRHDARSDADLGFWISHASLAGLPAVSAPVGRTAAGLPVGIQVIGPLHEDDTAITVAGFVGRYEPPPL
ncbi:MAG TPA: amidase family protein [Asanoa sp.]